MKNFRVNAALIIACLCFDSSQAFGARIDTRMIDGLKVLSPTRVQAGKPFQVKIISAKNKFTGVCWMDWSLSKGFSIPSEFKIKNGNASVRILPIEPGAGTMYFTCGTNKRDPLAGGSTQIYIAP